MKIYLILQIKKAIIYTIIYYYNEVGDNNNNISHIKNV